MLQRVECLHSMIKNIKQTAVINIIKNRILLKLDVSYAKQHTFSKVRPLKTRKLFIYRNVRGLEPRLRKLIFSSNNESITF